MLSKRLHRAQLDLQSHRSWLAVFVAHSQRQSVPPPYSGLVNRCHVQHHARPHDTRPVAAQKRARRPTEVARFATEPHRPKKQRVASYQPALPLVDLRQAVQDLRIKDVAELYSGLEDKSILATHDVRKIAQYLHHSLRAEKRSGDAKTRREDVEELVTFADELVVDIKRGNVPPHGQAHVHILGFYKESGMRDAGVRFWKWLEHQDDLHVNADVYGAAIDLLAVCDAPLAELEELYRQALVRFPGNFSAYHLSPDSIVPDRDQATTLKGIPIALLQGILTARLLRGDSRNAYLALDTALRLYPDQVPQRFLALFFAERPLQEAYTVFAIFCRGGMTVSNTHYKPLLSALRTSSNLSSVHEHVQTLRAMLASLYMFTSAGGQVTMNTVNEVIIATTQLLRLRGIAALDAKKKQLLVKEVMRLIRAELALFAKSGTKPSLPAFNSIITNMGGSGHSKQIIGIALSDLQALGLKPDAVTRRSILTAAGTLRDSDFVEKAWNGLVQGRADSGQHPDATDVHVLIKNARATGQIEFARQKFESVREHLSPNEQNGVELSLSQGEGEQRLAGDTPSLYVPLLLEEIEKIGADLKFIDERNSVRSHQHNIEEQTLLMTLMPTTSKVALPEADSRKLYDELTAEQRPTPDLSGENEGGKGEPASSSQDKRSSPESDTNLRSPPATTSNNIPFGVLRYENWKTINSLLEQAESSDKEYHDGIDKAIAVGAVPPPRRLSLSFQGHEYTTSSGLSDTIAPKTPVDGQKFDDAQIQRAKFEILRLRGRIPA